MPTIFAGYSAQSRKAQTTGQCILLIARCMHVPACMRRVSLKHAHNERVIACLNSKIGKGVLLHAVKGNKQTIRHATIRQTHHAPVPSRSKAEAVVLGQWE